MRYYYTYNNTGTNENLLFSQNNPISKSEKSVFLYEKANHLGNVLSVTSDRKLAHSSNTTTIDYYLADIQSATDYGIWGDPLPGRTFVGAAGYKFGFNGKEKDDEVKGNGNSYDFGARIYDPRIGRWLSLDPLQQKLPDLTPYNFVADNPLRFTDPDGQFLLDVHQRITKEALKGFQINFGFDNNRKNPQFGFGITGLGTVKDGGITYPDWNLAEDKQAHFDGMNFAQIIENTERIQKRTANTIEEFKSGTYNAQKLGHDVGENLHAIQDLYSHSNFVEIYADTYPDQKDISKIPTLNEALNDPAYAKFAAILKDDKNGLHTGKYDSEHPETGPDSHKAMNHDVGASSTYTSLMPETRGKKVTWFTQAAEAVATKASKEYLKDVKKEVEKK